MMRSLQGWRKGILCVCVCVGGWGGGRRKQNKNAKLSSSDRNLITNI